MDASRLVPVDDEVAVLVGQLLVQSRAEHASRAGHAAVRVRVGHACAQRETGLHLGVVDLGARLAVPVHGPLQETPDAGELEHPVVTFHVSEETAAFARSVELIGVAGHDEARVARLAQPCDRLEIARAGHARLVEDDDAVLRYLVGRPVRVQFGQTPLVARGKSAVVFGHSLETADVPVPALFAASEVVVDDLSHGAGWDLQAFPKSSGRFRAGGHADDPALSGELVVGLLHGAHGGGLAGARRSGQRHDHVVAGEQLDGGFGLVPGHAVPFLRLHVPRILVHEAAHLPTVGTPVLLFPVHHVEQVVFGLDELRRGVQVVA